jgi:hypothetical protein
MLLATAVFAMSPQMPWEVMPSLFRYIQFPWRLLVFGSFLAAALTIEAAPGLRRIDAGLFVPILLVALGQLLWVMEKHPPYLVEEPIENLPQRAITEEERGAIYLGTIVGEYLPFDVDPTAIATLERPRNWLEIISGEAIVIEESRRGTTFSWKVDAARDSTFRVRQFRFPVWHYYIDGEKADDRLEKIDWGMMKLSVPAGSHDLELVRGMSAPGRIGVGISVFALVLTVGMGIVLRGEHGRALLKGNPGSGPDRGDE